MTKNFPITIYHNARCGAARNPPALIREAGHEPTVIEDLKTGCPRETLARPPEIVRAPLP